MSETIRRFANPDSNNNQAGSKKYYSNIPQVNNSLPVDFNKPLAFSEWLKYQIGIDPNNQYQIYLQYIIKWYANSVDSDTTSDTIQKSYLSVLESLALVFRDEIKDEWVRELNFNEDIDVQDAIEFYSRKLKEIALYYINKRNEAQNAKLKYNLSGSEKAITELISDYILKAFTQREHVLNIPSQEIYNQLPQLSAVNNKSKVSIEYFFDKTNYFDKSPTAPVSAYFDTSSAIEFLSSNNITITPDVLYSSGIFDNQYASDPITFSNDLSSRANSITDVQFSEIMLSLTEKYTGAIKHRLAIYETLNNVITSEYTLEEGNNWFYWPSGEYVFEQDNLEVTPIPLKNTNLILQGATASEDYKNADKIFVSVSDDTTKAAWLKFTPSTTENKTISAIIYPKETLIFKFPYPGYGAAAKTLDWTGPEFSNFNTLYNFVDDETKKEIENAYFTNTTEFTSISVSPVNINESTLAYSGLTPSNKYSTSSKITRRNTDNLNKINDNVPDSVFTSTLEHSWLYDLQKTNLPLSIGQTNVIWPYKIINNDTLSFSVCSDACLPVNISDIHPLSGLSGSTAGRGLYDSDVLYKLNNVNGFARECAFLSGPELSASNLVSTKFTEGIDGVLQPGLHTKCSPGVYTTFLWCGDDELSLSATNIKYHEIPKDSEFYKTKHKSIYDQRTKTLEQIETESNISTGRIFDDFGTGPGVGDWKTDSSRSVLYSPIGHSGNTYDDYDNMSDIIFADWDFPNNFSLQSWRDDQGRNYKTSPDFAWFKLNNNDLFADVGWGLGEWVNYDGSNGFKLKQGIQYKYLRANLRRSDDEIDSNAVPYMIIRESFNLPVSTFEWKYAQLQDDSTWLATTSSSEIIVNPGDVLLYDHNDVTTYCVSTVDTRGFRQQDIQSISSSGDTSYWIDVVAAPVGSTLVANWPSTYYNSASALPSLIELDTITWILSTETNVKTWENIPAGVPISFTLANSGIYVLSAAAVLLDSTPYYNENIYFEITSFQDTFVYTPTGSLEYDTISYPNLTVDAAIQLHGWDIENSTTTLSNSNHAKPIWVKAYDGNDNTTRNKGVSIYGTNLGFSDEYVPRVQPDIDSWNLKENTLLEIKHLGNSVVEWYQPVEILNSNNEVEWKELQFDDIDSPLQDFSEHDLSYLQISATDKTSDIVLSPYTDKCKGEVFINYFAQNQFTWTQELSTYYTGTVTIVNSSLDTTPISPYAYLTNRHYPTMAILPDFSNIISEKNVGLFIPQNLGLGKFFTNNHTLTLSSKESISGIYLDIDKFESDYGFTQEYNDSAVSYIEYDAQWMKKGITTFARSGEISNPSRYQKFVPYVNSAEYKSFDYNTINNKTDPWDDYLDKNWRDIDNFPLDFRGQEKIATWYSENISPSGQVYQFYDDIYGNKYYLFKNIENVDLYTQKSLNGSLWVKTIDGKFGTASKMLSGVVDNYITSSYAHEITSGQIRDIYCYSDVLTIILQNNVLMERIKFDYDSGLPYSIADDSRIIETSGFGDIYYNTTDNCQYIVMNNINTGFEIQRLDINDFNLRKVFPTYKSNNVSLLSSLSALPDVEFDLPLIDHNKYTGKYNVSFFANASSGQHLVSVNLNEKQDHFDVSSVDIVYPTS